MVSIIIIYIQAIIICLTLKPFNCINTSKAFLWKCNDQFGFCERNQIGDIPLVVNNTSFYKSEEVCHLICGPYGSLWPQPTGKTILHKDLVIFNPKLMRFSLDDGTVETNKYFNQITKIFLSNILIKCKNSCIFLSNTQFLVNARIVDYGIDLKWTTNESYSLNISTINGHRIDNFIKDATVQVQIDAYSIFGVRHALETLSQMITITTEINKDNAVAILIANAHITDKPIYAHRGLMIDTARHFIPITALERSINGMGSSKLNIFHWHATDSQSFPLDLPRVPQMAKYGAYSFDQIYSKNDIEHIISYAKLRGVRVIMEIDAPSHAGMGWQWGPKFQLGNLSVCMNEKINHNYCFEPPCGQLNPANENIYKVWQNIYMDLKELLPPGETIHIGGDEVQMWCWNSSVEIVDYMRRQGFDNTKEGFLRLWSDYQSNIYELWNKVTKPNATLASSGDFMNASPEKLIFWSSQLSSSANIEHFLSKEKYIIQSWVNADSMYPKKLIDKGYSVIISTQNAWYFDHGLWGNTSYYTWQTVYNNRILKNATVLGGEACVWTEYIDNNTLDSKTWPRAAAVAERLWSDPDTNATSAEIRLIRHRERLIQMGIGAAPVTTEWCQQNEGACFS